MQITSIIQTRSQKSRNIDNLDLNSSSQLNIKPNKCQTHPNSQNKSLYQDKWLHDIHIESLFTCFREEVSKYRNDILLISPSTTQLIKLSSYFTILSTLSQMAFDQMNYVFFCVSDSENINHNKSNETDGKHWSLLLFKKSNNTYYHFDSIQGFNFKQAKQIANKINPTSSIIDVPTIQQTNNYECGMHVIVNAKSALNEIMYNTRNLFPFHSLFGDQTTKDANHQNIKHQVNLEQTLKPTSPKTQNNTIKPASFQSTNNQKINKHASNQKISKSTMTKCSKNIRKNYIHNSNATTTQNRFSVLSQLNNDNKIEEVHKSNTHTKYVDSDAKSCSQIETLCSEQLISKNKKTDQGTRIKRMSDNCLGTKYRHFHTKENTLNHPDKGNNTNKSYRTSIKTLRHESNTENEPCERSNLYKKNGKNHIKLFADCHGRLLPKLLCNNDISHNFNVLGICKKNGKVEQILESFRAETKNMNNKDYAIIIAGTNDINSSVNVMDIYNKIEMQIKSVSNTNILLSAIPFRYDDPNLNRKIRKLNYHLKEMPRKYPNCSFVQLTSFKRYHFTNDGLDFNILGKKEFLNIITELILNDTTNKNIPTIITQRNYFLAMRHPNIGLY